MIRSSTAIAAAAFALDALADEPLLSIVAGIALAIVCLWALAPEGSRR